MTALTTAARHALPAQAFAGPNRSFPVENPDHAVAALRMVGRAEAAGHISAQQAAEIRNKAHAVLSRAGGYAGQVMNAAQARQ